MDLYINNLYGPYKKKKYDPSMLGDYDLLEILQGYKHIHTPDI